MREKYGNEAPPEVATLTPEQAWAYGYNMALHAPKSATRAEIRDTRREIREAAPDVAHDDDNLTERTAEMLRDPEMMHKTGWVTPCDDWVDVHTITAHAATCATCRGAAQLPED